MEPTLPLELSDATGVPYYRQIVDQLGLLVRGGRLAAGARLPSVRELARQLLVSLITIRRAYADLEAAGLIVRRQGQGTFVADDVVAASREQASADGRVALERAVRHALGIGLALDEVRALFDELLTTGDWNGTD